MSKKAKDRNGESQFKWIKTSVLAPVVVSIVSACITSYFVTHCEVPAKMRAEATVIAVASTEQAIQDRIHATETAEVELELLWPKITFGYDVTYHPRWEDPRDQNKPGLPETIIRVTDFPAEAWPPPEDVIQRVFFWLLLWNRNTNIRSCADEVIINSVDFSFPKMESAPLIGIEVNRDVPTSTIKVLQTLCPTRVLVLPLAWIDLPVAVEDPQNYIRAELGEPEIKCEGVMTAPAGTPYAETDIAFYCSNEEGWPHFGF